METSLDCPSCRYPHVRRLSVVHRRGTSRGRGQQQDLLARDAAPPTAPSYGSLFGILLSAMLLVAGLAEPSTGLVVFASILLVISGLRFRAASRSRRDFPERMARWNRSYLCERCGHTFEPGRGTAVGPAGEAADTDPRVVAARTMGEVLLAGDADPELARVVENALGQIRQDVRHLRTLAVTSEAAGAGTASGAAGEGIREARERLEARVGALLERLTRLHAAAVTRTGTFDSTLEELTSTLHRIEAEREVEDLLR